MKSIPLLFLTLLILGCKSSAPGVVIVPMTKVSESHRSANYEFVKQQFDACTTGQYVAITKDIATPKLAETLTIDVMKQTCAEINEKYGELTKLTLYEVVRRGESKLIYRYKAYYSKTEQTAEIRLYTDPENRYSGLIFRKIWTIKYYIAPPDKE